MKDKPLQAPSSPPKSKVPKLQHGGLSPPSLHCLATSLLTNPASPLQEKAIFLTPAPKSLTRHPSGRHSQHYSQHPIRQDQSESERARSQLRDVFYEIHFSSKLFCEIDTSEFMDQHIDRIADSGGTGGLLAYIQIWNHWACWCQCQLKHRFHFYWIISMHLITSKDGKTQNHPEHG